MMLAAIIIVLTALGVLAFSFSNAALVALVIFASATVVACLAYDLVSIREEVESFFNSTDRRLQRERSPRVPFFSSTVTIISLIAALRHRMGALVSKLENLTERLRRSQSERFSLEAESDEKLFLENSPEGKFLSFSRRLLETALFEFRARGIALVVEMKALGESDNKGAAPSQLLISSVGSAGSRFEKTLHTYVKDFFLLGETDKLGVRDLFVDRNVLQDLSIFGFRYINLLPLFFSVRGKTYRGALWFGYDPDRAPMEQELKFAEELAPRISKELRTFFEFRELEGQVQQVRKSQHAKNEMIAHLSHDIRSPLSNIKSILQLIRLEGLQADSGEMLTVALRNCDSLKEMVEDLLDYSRHTLGGLKAASSKFCLRELAESVTTSFLVSARLKGLDLRTERGDVRSLVEADRKQLRRVLNNLVGNAIKYTERGTITVSVINTGESSVSVAITDTGRGLTPDQVQKLFIPFNRFDDGAHEGIGLGLALSKILVGLNQGELEVYSNFGSGSEFRVKMPLAKEQSRTMPLPEAYAANG